MRRSSLAVPFALVALLVGGILASAGPASATIATTMTPVVVADAHNPVAGQPYGLLVSLMTASGQQPVVNVTVELWVKRVGQSAYSEVASTHSDSSGLAQPVTTVTRNSYVYAVFRGNDSYGPSQTAELYIPVSTSGTMNVDDKTLRVGQRLVVTGKTRPGKPGRRVALYVGYIPSPSSPGTPTRIARAYVRADGTYRITKRFQRAGSKRLFVRLPGGDGNVPGYTRYRRVRVG
jgi:hypothetical protein